jgi:UDP-N-acetylmuramoyl-L-alanyl-D-glutamate--2,6-diaminopimelate ligase
VLVPNAAIAAAELAAKRLEHPSRQLNLVGITGTNGKTTTALILRAILAVARRRWGVLGTTVGARWMDRHVATGLTTPEAPELQTILAAMVEDEIDTCAMEVSSHGIALHRVAACDFAVGIFTGLGRDHLDFHESLEDYAETKVNWLLGEVQQSRTLRGVVAPVDDPYGAEILSEFRYPAMTFGFDDEADIYPIDVEFTPTGTKGRVSTPIGSLTISLRLAGRHNLRNAMAAIGAALLLDIEPIDIVDGLSRVPVVRGRFEPVPNDKGLHVLVDYAHTPDALETAITSLRELTDGRVITVFGCGGDRDRAKRPEMARAVHQNTDVMVVTSDNPRSEDPQQIINDILAGLPDTDTSDNTFVEIDRQKAIAKAIELLTPSDVLLIAGKGHETVQIIGDDSLAFDDVVVAQQLMTTEKVDA